MVISPVRNKILNSQRSHAQGPVHRAPVQHRGSSIRVLNSSSARFNSQVLDTKPLSPKYSPSFSENLSKWMQVLPEVDEAENFLQTLLNTSLFPIDCEMYQLAISTLERVQDLGGTGYRNSVSTKRIWPSIARDLAALEFNKEIIETIQKTDKPTSAESEYLDHLRNHPFSASLEKSLPYISGLKGWSKVTSWLSGPSYFEQMCWLRIFDSYDKNLQLQEAQLKLTEAIETASHDGLTGAFNRGYFDTHLENLIPPEPRRASDNVEVTLLMIDLDFFKRLNDTYGHLYGDECLQSVAIAIQKAIRSEDIFARYGGEEFAVVIKSNDPEEVIRIVNRIHSSITNLQIPHTKNDSSDANGFVTASIGMAKLSQSPDGLKNPQGLIKLADEALYKAKNNGRNQIAIHGVPIPVPAESPNGTEVAAVIIA